jgi:hypothetical protein
MKVICSAGLGFWDEISILISIIYESPCHSLFNKSYLLKLHSPQKNIMPLSDKNSHAGLSLSA